MRSLMLKKPLSKNQLDDLTDGLVNAMRYSDPSVEYPSFDEAKPDDGVMAEWFYPIHNGTNDFSELTAILMYVNQEATFSEIGELTLGIAMTEMKHYDKLSDFIRQIGGRIDQRYINSGVVVGETIKDALKTAIAAEKKTIDFYEELQTKLIRSEETVTVRIAIQFLSKLIADEEVHLRLLENRYDEL